MIKNKRISSNNNSNIQIIYKINKLSINKLNQMETKLNKKNRNKTIFYNSNNNKAQTINFNIIYHFLDKRNLDHKMTLLTKKNNLIILYNNMIQKILKDK